MPFPFFAPLAAAAPLPVAAAELAAAAAAPVAAVAFDAAAAPLSETVN